MDGACDNTLASSGLAQQKYSRIHGSNLFDQGKDLRKGVALANNFAEVVLACDLLSQVDIFCLESVFQYFDFFIRFLKGPF
jgi:hypothetical protein